MRRATPPPTDSRGFGRPSELIRHLKCCASRQLEAHTKSPGPCDTFYTGSFIASQRRSGREGLVTARVYVDVGGPTRPSLSSATTRHPGDDSLRSRHHSAEPRLRRGSLRVARGAKPRAHRLAGGRRGSSCYRPGYGRGSCSPAARRALACRARRLATLAGLGGAPLRSRAKRERPVGAERQDGPSADKEKAPSLDGASLLRTTFEQGTGTVVTGRGGDWTGVSARR